MSDYRVVITPRAMSDLERNALWWADNHSALKAVEWFDAFEDALMGLSEFPDSHPLAEENQDYEYELRELLFGLGSRRGYRAVFTVRDTSVVVLAIRSAEQDRIDPSELPRRP